MELLLLVNQKMICSTYINVVSVEKVDFVNTERWTFVRLELRQTKRV